MLDQLKAAARRACAAGKTKVWYVLLLLFPFAEQIVDLLSGMLPAMLLHGGIFKWMGWAVVAAKAALQFWSFVKQFRTAKAAADASLEAHHG